MSVTEQQLLQIFPSAGRNAGVFVSGLNSAMQRYQISSAERRAAFLAQVGHESGQLNRLVENLNYDAAGLARVWPKRYARGDGSPNALALNLARHPQAIANNTYAERNGNGSEASGDGWTYRGRGLLQVTGRANYRATGAGIGKPLESLPELLEQPELAALSAAWWWAGRGLNELADTGRFEDITRRINGGLNGLVERVSFWRRAQEVLA